MTLSITHLDGSPVLSVETGTDYLVPCVYGIPVICPSHIDEGNDGATSRHWHTDDRFGKVGRNFGFWSEEVQKSTPGFYPCDDLNSSIVKDGGEPVVMEKKRVHKSQMWASGGVFSSMCWLYATLGHKAARNGLCVHHQTPLVQQDGCLECPAHALKYKTNGEPRCVAPFFLSVEYIHEDGSRQRARSPLKIDEDGVIIQVQGIIYPGELISLEDSNGECIIESEDKVTEDSDKLVINITAWPSHGACPGLAACDPRGTE